MFVYLDAKDLIDVFDHEQSCSRSQFINLLTDGGHYLVLSMTNVREVAAPLLDSNSKTSVTLLLNRIEGAPIKYIREGTLNRDELTEAVKAFSENREFEVVDPYVRRYDYTFVQEDLISKYYIHFPLAEIVFTLWAKDPNVLRLPHGQAEYLRKQFAYERSMENRDSVARNFITSIKKKLQFHGLSRSGLDNEQFAQWVYESPSRCPALRLSYEVYHAIQKNLGDVPKDSDIPDFAHLMCTPYVDLITLDRRIRNYVGQVASRIGLPYKDKVCKDVGAVLDKLANRF